VILGVDTDILVTWVMKGAPLHAAVRQLLDVEVRERGSLLGLTPQVVHEFLHVATDPRRFESPLSLPEALRICRSLGEAMEVHWILPAPEVLPRTLDLMEKLRLGRKRILDTALATTLESAGVHRLATLNSRDFEVFPFLELVGPDV
jgi:predicted nucleic acid-binding protein